MRRLSSKLKKALNGQKKSERRPVGWEEESEGAIPDTSVMPSENAGEEGLVVSISRRSCRLFFEGELIDCLLPKSLAREQQSRLAVGDRIRFEKRADRNVVLEVLPRRTLLSRPDPHDPDIERAIAANVDQVVQVVSVKSPPLHPRLIDRYMIAAQRGEAAYVLCVNKVDLLEEGEDLPELQPYRALGVPVILCSTKQRQGLTELRAILEGKTSVLVGHSGVGKSSLLNALEPELRLATKEVGEASGTGRHATTSSTLFRFDAGTWVIDTPGIRELGLFDLTAKTLVWYFPEFEPYVVQCYFRDCSHSHEPSCAVRDAAEKGEIIRERYETYLRLMEELRGA